MRKRLHFQRLWASLLVAIGPLLGGTLLPAVPAAQITPQDPLDEVLPTLDRDAPGPRIHRPSPAGRASFRSTNWAAVIDSTWGPSPLEIPQMLGLFNDFWNKIDWYFACFQDLSVDWNALRDRYTQEIAGGVSRGRFAAIMNHLSLALRESHTSTRDSVVNVNTPPDPGVPLMHVGAWGDVRHFGAGLTPLADSTLLVYRAVSPHPLGLVPGDVVLGYEEIPWKRLYPELLAAELPIKRSWWWGSSGSAYTHSWLMSAGMNWHLFSTIDVVKYATQDTLHLSVAPLIGQSSPLICTEQLPVPGVPMPDLFGQGDPVSWGIIDGTQIGYIYVWAWANNAGTDFENAVDSLMTHHETSGLIIDFRRNSGGNMLLSYPALELLFNSTVFTIGFASRCDINNHLAMCPDPNGDPSFYVIHGDPSTHYDKPIAVLVGPGALSAGDQVANLLKFHPRARFFGKSTAAAFNGPTGNVVSFPSWFGRYAISDAYLVSSPGNYLTHDEFAVSEPVWLMPDDVVQGRDTVVEAAVAWISASTGIAGAPVVRSLAVFQNAPNPFSPATTIRFALPGGERASLRIYDPAGRLVRILFDEVGPRGEGEVVWDRTDSAGRPVPAGVYYYALDAGGPRQAKKMVVLE